MKERKATRYMAECGKGFWNKKQCLDHEDNCYCWKNPKNKTCKNCKFSSYQRFDNETGDGGFYDCSHNKFDQHSGAPKEIDYISVNCVLYENATAEPG